MTPHIEVPPVVERFLAISPSSHKKRVFSLMIISVKRPSPGWLATSRRRIEKMVAG
jgi:hypothetical protein